MKEIENKNTVLDRFDVIYKIVSIISGLSLLAISILQKIENQKIDSQIIIIGSIYLTTVLIFVFTVKWDKIYNSRFLLALKESGVTGVYLNNRANYQKMLKTLEHSIKTGNVNNIKIMVYHGYYLLSTIKEPLKKAIKNNAKVRIIIAESDGAYIKDVWKLESIHEDKSLQDIERENRRQEEAAFEIIKELIKTAEKEGGNFKYKRYTTQARYALVAINKSWGWWTPYQPGLKVLNTTSFVLEKEDEPDNATVLGQCIDHFNTLWNSLPNPKPEETQDITNTTGA